MRDCRNDFITEIKLGLGEIDNIDCIMAVIINTLNQYEITERSTEIVPYDTGNMKLLKAYVGSMIINGKAKSTISAYAREIKKLANFLLNMDLKTVTAFDIRNFLAQEKLRGISNRTLENTRAYIRSFYEWLTIEEYIPKNPCNAVKPIKYSDEVRNPFSNVEVDLLRSNCKNEKERAIIEVLLSSGVRVSELCNLNLQDIDFQKQKIHIRHGKGDKDRTTYTDSVACDHLIKYLTGAGITCGAVFMSQRGRYTPGGIRTVLNTIAARANVVDVHPHRFRRTFATRLAARGMAIQEIQKLMGHSDINTTMIYVSMDDSRVQSSYKQFTA